jgi:hypothetical protein
MEDKENLSEYDKKRIDYEDKLREKILNTKKLRENNLAEITLQKQRLLKLPQIEQEEINKNMIYWSTTGVCYFFIGLFYIRRPKRFWKRIAVWVPTLLIYEWCVISHYFWSVKDKVKPIIKFL